MINVLIVEDQRMMRETMENYINQAEGYKLAGSIAGASLATAFCKTTQVDLVLMDVCTENDESGFEATKALKAQFPKIKVIIVTSMLDVGYLKRAKEVGADSFWYKDISRVDLIKLIIIKKKKKSVYPNRTQQVKIGNASVYEFSEAEINVLRLLVEGMTYKEMGEKLGVTSDCVKKHIGNMLSKTGFTSKTKLAAMVMSKRVIVNGF